MIIIYLNFVKLKSKLLLLLVILVRKHKNWYLHSKENIKLFSYIFFAANYILYIYIFMNINNINNFTFLSSKKKEFNIYMLLF